MANNHKMFTVHISISEQERAALERLVKKLRYPWTVRSVVRQAIKEKLEKEQANV